MNSPNGIYLGFGIDDNNTNDYKVVVIYNWGQIYSYPEDHWHVKLYNCATESWNTISLDHDDVFSQLDPLTYPPFLAMDCNPEFSHCLLNGVHHWSCFVRPVDIDSYFAVLAFDFANEAFRLIQGPPLPNDHEGSPSLCVLRESLAMVVTYDGNVEVWVMKEYGVKDSWAMLYSFEHTVGLTVVGIPNDVQIFFQDQNDGQLISASFNDGEFKEHDFCIGYDIIPISLAQYVETLGILKYVATLAPLNPIDHDERYSLQ